jgi:hypothetical protein
MTSYRKIIPIVAGFAALSAMSPTAATAGSLLSGYGGPGQGNQSVLGSALLNGSGNGGGGSGTGGGSSTGGGAATGGSGASAPGSASGISAQESPGGATRGSGTAGRHRAAARPGRSTAGGAGLPVFRGYTASQRSSAAHPWLGISGEDLLYVIVALAVLAFTGTLTLRLAGAGRRSSVGISRDATQSPTN